VQALQAVFWIRISLKADQDPSFLVDVDPDPIQGFDSRIVKFYSRKNFSLFSKYEIYMSLGFQE
jgi:hypothetical protein